MAGKAAFGHANAELHIFDRQSAKQVATRSIRQRRPPTRETLPPEARSNCGEILVATEAQVVVCRYAFTEPGPDGWSVAAFEPHAFSVPELSRLAP